MEAQGDPQAARKEICDSEESEVAPGERERGGETENVHGDDKSDVNFVGEVLRAFDFGRLFFSENILREGNLLCAFIELLRSAVWLRDYLHAASDAHIFLGGAPNRFTVETKTGSEQKEFWRRLPSSH